MSKFMIVTPSVTYALKGRDALRRAGLSATVKRKREQNTGCGYGIVTSGDIRRIEQVLIDASVKILEIKDY